MQGIGKFSNLDIELPRVIQNAYFYTGDRFETLSPGQTKTSTRDGEFGPEIGFAMVMARPDRPVYLVKYHASGMALHRGWNGGTWVGGEPAPARRNFYPGRDAADINMGVLYKEMLDMYVSALQHLRQSGHNPVVRGFVWMQGEQDSKNEESARSYSANLRHLVNRLGEDLDVAGGLPMVFGQVLPHEPAAPRFTHRNEIRRQMAIADGRSARDGSIKSARMVSTDGMSVLPDTVHYDARGQLALGKEFGLSLQKLLDELAMSKEPHGDTP